MKPKIVISDFDGTLFSPHTLYHPLDVDILHRLGKANILRIIATGRSMYSLRKVLPNDFPVDYIIFSSGAGILEWKSQNILYSELLHPAEVKEITAKLYRYEFDFMLHDPIPHNHRFSYYLHDEMHPDFERRLKLYAPYAERIYSSPIEREATQAIVINTDGTYAQQVIGRILNHFNVIRTTSPLDGQTRWIEIFPKNVSKAKAAEWLCTYLNISIDSTLAVGNDYNDQQLLDWAAISFITETAPNELKDKYRPTLSPARAGFSKAVLDSIQFLGD